MKSKFDIITAVFIAALVGAGCEGDPGVPGKSQLPGDLRAPSVEIILPLASRPIYEQTIIEVQVSDDDSVARTEFLVDGIPPPAGVIVPHNPPTQYLWNSAPLAFGQHSLQMLAWDRSDKVGQSATLYLNRADFSFVGNDTLRLYDDDEKKLIKWRIPTDSLGTFRGVATRFIPDRRLRVLEMGVRLYRNADWADTSRLIYELLSVKDGLPDTLIARDSLKIRALFDASEDFDGFVTSTKFRSIDLTSEFILAVRQLDVHVGDTVAVETDDGLWKNGHGLVLTSDGGWRPFTTGLGRHYNPIIFAKVRYQ